MAELTDAHVVGDPVDTAERDAQVSAADDEVLDRILEAETPEDHVKEVERERDESGKFKKKETTETPVEPTAEDDPKDTPAPATAPSADSVHPDGYDKALKALQRARVPKDILKSMDPDSLTEWGLETAKVQAERDQLGNEVKKLRGHKDGADVDLTQLAEILGDDVAEPVKAAFEKMAEQFQQSLEPIRTDLTHQQREAARVKLQDEWSLADDGRWAQVLATREHDLNVYGSESDAMEVACLKTFGRSEIAKLKSNLGEQHDKRTNGQSTTKTKGAAPPSSLAGGEREDKLLDAILDDDVKGRDRHATRRSSVNMLDMMDRTVGAPSK